MGLEITLIQGILLAVVAFICGVDQCWEAFYWFRPMVVAFFAGIVLGDMKLGIAAGAVSELSYLGLLTVGGTVPPDPLMAGMMTVVIAYTTGKSAETALGLSLPFALLAQWMGIFFNTVYAGFMKPLEKAAAEFKFNKFKNTVYLAIVIKAGCTALLVFLAAYGLQEPIANFVNAFPEKLINGFKIAGGMLPAVGLGLLLMVMLKKENAPYLFIGFLIATFTNVGNVLPIAVAGVAIAYIDYMYDQRMAKASPAIDEGGSDDDGI
ncbi:MAG: PTS sugar transporter subunit IIC [Erysipelotrichaceae bacterium]